MLIVAFVDIFAFYRPDIHEQVEAGRVLVFEIGEAFMLGVVVYVVVPTLMITLSLTLPWRVNRVLTWSS